MANRNKMADHAARERAILSIMSLCPEGTTYGQLGWAIGHIQGMDCLGEEAALTQLARQLEMGMGLPS